MTCSIKVSGVGGWSFVQWCFMTWSRNVFVLLITGYGHQGAEHILSPNSGVVKARRMARA